MRKLLFIITLFLLSCEFTNYDRLINDENTAANAGTPGVTISSPWDNEHVQTFEITDDKIFRGKNITLSGYANDGSGNPIDDDAVFTWTLDDTLKLGSGREVILVYKDYVNALTPGKHTISLSVEDIWGNVDSRTVTVHMPHLYREDFSSNVNMDRNATSSLKMWDTADQCAHLGPVQDYTVFGSYYPMTKGNYIENSGDVAISGDYVYAVNGSGRMDVINIQNPLVPVKVASYESQYAPGDNSTINDPEHMTPLPVCIAISGNYAYLGGYDNCKLDIIDISNPGAPARKGYKGTGNTCDIAISGSYAYVLTNRGLEIFDVTDPAIPVLKNTISLPGGTAIVISGNSACISCSLDGIFILDITDRTNPVNVGSITTGGNATDVALSGNYAFVADSSGGLVVVDISNPAVPLISGLYSEFPATRITVAGQNAYIINNTKNIQIIDISDPMFPKSAGTCSTRDRTLSVAASGDYAYFIDNYGMAAINITSRIFAIPGGTYYSSDQECKLAVSGNYAYIANNYNPINVGIDGSATYTRNNLLSVINISNPAAPLPSGLYYDNDTVRNITLSGNNAYIQTHNSIDIINISDPLNPVKSGSSGLDTTRKNIDIIKVLNNYAYTGSNSFGFSIYRIESTGIFSPLSEREYQCRVSDFVISGNYAYVACGADGLLVLDIGNPNSRTQPVYKGQYKYNSGTAGGIAVSDKYVYIAYGSAGFIAIDISNPANPVYKGKCSTPGSTSSIVISGKHAYVLDSSCGIVDIDINDPSNPVSVGKYTPDVSPKSISVSGNYIYTLGNDGCLSILIKGIQNNVLYHTKEQTVQSNKINIFDYNHARFLSMVESENETCNIEMSIDKGSSWQQVPDQILMKLDNTYSDLRWRARMKTDNSMNTPVLHSLIIEYWEE